MFLEIVFSLSYSVSYLHAISRRKNGPRGESNSGPLAPEARIIPLDHEAAHNSVLASLYVERHFDRQSQVITIDEYKAKEKLHLLSL